MAQTANDFPMYKGEDVSLTFTVYGSSSTSTPLDVTGWAATFSVKTNPSDTSALVTKAIAGASNTCSTGGKLVVSLNSSDTLSLPNGLYAHDLWRTDAGSQAALSVGTLNLHWSVLRP